MQQMIGNFRTLFLFRGLAAVLFGILTLVWPKLSLTVLVLLFGVFAVIGGITAVAAALRNTEMPGWGFLLFEGILGILAGVVALVWPGITALAFLFLLATWAIITGILEIVAPLSFPMSGGRSLLSVLTGLVSIVFGVASPPVISILRAFVSSRLGSVTFKTPSLNSALASSAETVDGSVNERVNEPYARSIR